MKIFVLLSLFLSIPYCFAQKAPLLNKLKCSNTVLKSISDLGESREWKKNSDGTVSTDFESGGNVRITIEAMKSVVTSNQNGIILKLEFSEPDCKIKILKISSSTGGFLDRDLDLLLKKNSHGLIFLWSPHMSLSVNDLVEMKKYLATEKIPVTILLDLNTDIDSANKSLQKIDLPLEYLKRANSRKIDSFGANIYYPSVIFYKSGELIKRVPGFNGKKSLQDLVNKHFEIAL